MTIFDLTLLFILAGFVFYGLFFGFIRTFGSLAGVIIGILLAKRFYLAVFNWMSNLLPDFNVVGKVACFIIVFTLVYSLVRIIFALLDRAFDILSIIPFLKTINRLLGAILGLVEGGIVLGLILYTMAGYFSATSFPGIWLTNSRIAYFFLPIFKSILAILTFQ